MRVLAIAIVVVGMTGCSLLVSSSGLSGGADAVDSGAGGDAGRLPDGAPADVITARDAANGDGDAEPPSDPSLVLWLRFDEAVQGTSLKDSSSYAGAAALQGTAKVVSGGHVGGALALDGSTSCYVSIPHRPELLQLTKLTLTAWVDVTYVSSTNPRLLSMGDRFDVKLLWAGPSQGSPQITTTTGYARSLWTTAAGQWHHVALVFENGTTTIYGDGTVSTLTDDTIAANSMIDPSTTGLILGALGDGSERYTGLLDEVRVYSRALSAAEIATLANQ